MEMALAMGGQDGPVTRAVTKALRRNEGYGELTELALSRVIC